MARKRQKRADGTFEIKVTIGRDRNGKPIRKSFYSAKSVADAKRRAEEYKQSMAKEKSNLGDSVRKSALFSEWAETWLEVYKQPFVSDATYRSTYEAYVYNHMIPYFGRRQLRDITQADVQKYFSIKANKSQSFLNKNRFMLSAIFDTAIENDLCERNPVKHIKYTSKQIKHDKKALTDEQIDILEQYAEGKRPEIILLLNTGLRRGELCGLQWTDINLREKTLTVNRAIAESGGKCSVNPPKFQSYRTIPLNGKALDVLRQQPKKSIWIFPSRTGDFRRPDKWTDILEKFMRGLPPELQCTSHELRHTYGSFLRRHGVDIYTIQQILGHKDINVTAGTYVHADIDAMRTEIEAANHDKNHDKREPKAGNNSQ
ncbi:MAG: site-specific integrase [Butyricicoccus porcorum]|nr:site-specific integrase [Butyricicoccus porcorum]